MREELFDCKLGAIAELWWVNVAQEDDRGSNLQLEPVRRNTRQLKRVEELDRVLNSNRVSGTVLMDLYTWTASGICWIILGLMSLTETFNGARTAISRSYC